MRYKHVVGGAAAAGVGEGAARLHKVNVCTVSAGSSLTLTDSSVVGSTTSIAVIDCGTIMSYDFGGVLCVNGLFASATGTGGKPDVVISYE